jgi:RNA polymerase sigma-70 factor, ECF subfamily
MEQVVDDRDADLMLGLTLGDERAFAAMYDRFAVRMFRTALRLLGSREDAEDAVQDVFVATVRSRDRFSEVRDITAYLFAALHRAAGRCAVKRKRSQQTRTSMPDEPVVRDTRTAMDSAEWDCVQQAIHALPDAQREVVILRVEGELTFAQIAHVLGVSVSTAASRYQYALKKMKASLLPEKPIQEGGR